MGLGVLRQVNQLTLDGAPNVRFERIPKATLKFEFSVCLDAQCFYVAIRFTHTKLNILFKIKLSIVLMFEHN